MSRALNIVVAEDEKDTREYLQAVLTRLGHQVVAVATGPALVEAARVGEPDLVVADLKLPGTDAIAASLAINRHREVPVILVTGYEDAAVLEPAVIDHIMAYLHKPVGEANLKTAIAIALARFGQYLHLRKES